MASLSARGMYQLAKLLDFWLYQTEEDATHSDPLRLAMRDFRDSLYRFIVTTVEKQQKEHHRKKRQEEEFYVKNVSANPDAVLHLNKFLYSDAAKHFHVSVSSVDRNLRTIVHVCWKRGNRTFLDEIAGVHLVIQPTNGMFLDIAASYLRREKKT